MIPIIIIIISLILDGLLTNFFPFTIGNLSIFTPLLTIVSLFSIYPFYLKNSNKYYMIAIIMGIVYDLFYTNLLFLNGILFLILSIMIKYLYKNFEVNHLNIILYVIILITIYEGLQAGLIIIFNLVPMSFSKLFYKISHSLLLNIIYAEILYFTINHISKKYRKININ